MTSKEEQLALEVACDLSPVVYWDVVRKFRMKKLVCRMCDKQYWKHKDTVHKDNITCDEHGRECLIPACSSAIKV